MRGPPRAWTQYVDGGGTLVLPPLSLSPPRTHRTSCWRRVYAACHHVGAGSISPEKDGALLGQTAKRFHPPTSWVSTLARRWEWVWTCKNVEKRTQLCPVLLEPNWSWTRSDKMRGEIVRLGSNLGRPPNGTCVLTAGSVAGRRVPDRGATVCAGTVRRALVATGTAPARLQQHRQDKAPSNPDGARGREQEWVRKCGPCGSHECRSSRRPRLKGAGE